MTDIRRTLLRGMADIVGDLYGQPIPARNTATLKAASAPVPDHQPSLPPFVKLWKTADDSIDWTDALVSPTPTDGVIAPDKWALYHRYADAVLHGDVKAYLAVLQADNPMADLTPYVSALDVTTVDADALRASFSPRQDLMDEQAQAYLCGMAVRIARDLFAALPVLQVTVQAMQDDRTLLTVTFDRKEMNRVRFAFIDPVAYVSKCGGTFPEA